MRKSLPDGIVDARCLPSSLDKGVEIGLERASLVLDFCADISRIGGIEAHPKKDEPDVVVIIGGLRPAQPA